MIARAISKPVELFLFILVFILSTSVAAAQEAGPEPGETDTVKAAIPDTIPEKSIEYVQYTARDSLVLNSHLVRTINNTAYSTKHSNSTGEAVRTYSGFKLLRTGPYAQPEYIMFGGMPVRSFVFGDFVFDYAQFGLPVNGLVDSRLIGYEQAAYAKFPFFSTVEHTNALHVFRPAYPDSGALTSAYMQKGDYGFSNTMVKFRGNLGERGRLGFTAGFKLSDGYVTNQAKDFETYRLFADYQLSENLQLQPDLAFFSSDDELRFLNEFENYQGRSEASFVGLSMALAAKERVWILDRISFIFQRFSESVRGDHDKFRQVSQFYKLKLETSINISDWYTYLNIEPFARNIEFEPETTEYAGLTASGLSRYDLLNNFFINVSGAVTISDYAENDISLAGGLSYSKSGSLILSGQLFRITRPPSDFELFASSPQIDLLPITGGEGQFSFQGNSDLDNTDYIGYSLGMKFDKGIFEGDIYLKQAEISNSTWWTQNVHGSSPYQRDANWIVGGFDLSLALPLGFDSRFAYSYGLLEDSDSEVYLTLAPRHNACAFLTKEIYIPGLNLYVLSGLEGEYHSENFKSPYNPQTLGEYFLMNAQFQFKIKTLTIFYNMDNVFNKPHRDFYNYELRRRIWWGFLWNFRN
ncbi:MAG TPA: hypothetical protein ENO22_10800 [candidate division Zixibacteria bacterium]|nr:hypothetical protein [candidate division Zixibacteria bacterium]HEQ99815.1 hypothetical protein [candidate division Zixibacteria bacterium]